MGNNPIYQEQLLAEVEDLLRTMPDMATIRNDTEENFSWMGRVAAIIEEWYEPKSALFTQYLTQFHSMMAQPSHQGLRQIIVLLHQARADLRLRTIGPTNVAIEQGRVFDYFDEIRNVITLTLMKFFSLIRIWMQSLLRGIFRTFVPRL